MKSHDVTEIALWYISMDVQVNHVQIAKRLLTLNEIEAANRFHFEKHRTRFILRRAARRVILSKNVGLPMNALSFGTKENGKPLLLNPEAPAFSTSNSDDMALVGIAPYGCVGELGVDIEKLRALSDGEGLSRRHGTEHEYHQVKSALYSERDALVLRYWTVKEAWLKATGAGVAEDLQRLDIRLRSDTAAVLRENGSRQIRPVATLCHDETYLVAVAYTAGEVKTSLQVFDWESLLGR